jgi:hypothetical protein
LCSPRINYAKDRVQLNSETPAAGINILARFGVARRKPVGERDEEEIKKSSGEKRRERGMSIILE